MKKIEEDSEKIKKRLTIAADLVLSQCDRVFDLDIWLRKASSEAARLNSQAGDLISELSDAYGRFCRDLASHTANESAIWKTVSDAADKAAKLEDKAAALAEKMPAIIAKLDLNRYPAKKEENVRKS